MYQNENFAGSNGNNLVSKAVFNDVKYYQFCTMFGLTQIIKYPTGISRSITLNDHLLASAWFIRPPTHLLHEESKLEVGTERIKTEKYHIFHFRITRLMLIKMLGQ